MLTTIKTKISDYRLYRGFRKLQKRILSLQPMNSNDVMNFLFSKKGELISPWQFTEELTQLLELYQNHKPKYILEIGTANGGTLFAHCRLAPDDATLISIDLPSGKFGGGYPDWKTPLYKIFAKPNQKLYLIRDSSHAANTVEQVRSMLHGKKFDYLFIDGDHTYEGVKKDFELYIQFAAPNALIVFHDIAHHPDSSCQVDRFWNEIKTSYRHQEFIKEKTQTCFGIGILFLK